MKIVIVSGYFNPLHGGHLDMIEAAQNLGDELIVIVNNDKQQLLKKGKIILDEDNRVRLMKAIRGVDEVMLSIDEDRTSVMSVEAIAQKYPDDELIFANGGDWDSDRKVPETEVCEKHNIRIIYGVGTDVRGYVKPDSSTRINQALGHEN